MSPLNRQKLDQIRDERREGIKQAALKVFARRGYTGTKMSLIAKEASISEGLIYRYFKSKKELFITLIQELIEEARRELEHVQHLPGTPFEQIKSLTENMLDENNKYAFMLIERARKDDDVPEKVTRIFENIPTNGLTDLLVPVFIKGQKSGEFSSGEPRKLLTWYFTIVISLLTQEQEEVEYGLPDVEVLMRILAK
ncbi:TPA: TetR/AcrR family transcriptional regulator [Bacillus tropicus]|uniref:TetR/AcrR family transcriptional regulator n=1 Tax=Bacillus cereus group TaxID=86661 RepID=UPI00003CB606|nr:MULTISPECIES: TetR/AcrR family transcriptional regulator [Bacillus cereus group]AJI07997.1 bacterial regulatory s, tetR family protein [Bacillus cereus G9241]AIY72985.1 bacterial regulatory s, tetR family protein [Bacillus cereus]EAL16033.1 transcriptional regulator, tetR family, putative [Bacillus cereus G9241]KDB42871.1 TetR family transcriptional regulator [Bacillus cereus]QPS53499.1 TetR/AcrR family transcriptional regulator [Bacillus tropicus]